jgi:hypothetical protein
MPHSKNLVLVPVRMFPATSTEGTIAFRMIHEPSGKPIKYLKGIETNAASKRFWRKRSSKSTPEGTTSSSIPRNLTN